MANQVQNFYGNRLRVRACGICVQDNQLLMVNHQSVLSHDFWAPPGGGAEFGETLTDCLKREFAEETGLIIETGELLFTCEFLRPPLHAIELFFSAEVKGGNLKRGADPEMNTPVIKDVRFVPWHWLRQQDPRTLHGIFLKVKDPSEIMLLRGYFKLE